MKPTRSRKPVLSGFDALLTPQQARTLRNEYRRLSPTQVALLGVLIYSEESLQEVCRLYPLQEAKALLARLQRLHECQKEWHTLTASAIERISKTITALER